MIPSFTQRIRIVDSHTGGEPTRVLLPGSAEPKGATMMEKRTAFARDFDWLRTASVCEPRGHDAMVGALLCEPIAENCAAGVIFFTNVGCLNGCLHGTMGVVVTLAHLGKIGAGEHRIDTPSGVVTATLGEGGRVTVRNVPCYRHRSQVAVEVAGFGNVCGDIAWGGNWFFLTEGRDGMPVVPENLEELTDYAWAIRKALGEQGITGKDGGEIDHIEVFGAPSDPSIADSRNFVLCPGKAYDRSPCGTGTSAKLACLFAVGKLAPGQLWRQAGILDSVFEGRVEIAPASSPENSIIPVVTGSAFVTAEAELLIDPDAPFAFGIPSLLS